MLHQQCGIVLLVRYELRCCHCDEGKAECSARTFCKYLGSRCVEKQKVIHWPQTTCVCVTLPAASPSGMVVIDSYFKQ